MKIRVVRSTHVLQGVRGVKVTQARVNTIAEINTKDLASLLANVTELKNAITDIATDAANAAIAATVPGEISSAVSAAIAAIPSVDVATCDPGGTITVLTR